MFNLAVVAHYALGGLGTAVVLFVSLIRFKAHHAATPTFFIPTITNAILFAPLLALFVSSKAKHAVRKGVDLTHRVSHLAHDGHEIRSHRANRYSGVAVVPRPLIPGSEVNFVVVRTLNDVLVQPV